MIAGQTVLAGALRFDAKTNGAARCRRHMYLTED